MFTLGKSIVGLGLVLLAMFAPPALAQDTRTARDLYVDAWFKETAESDFAGALKLYRECADRAAASDRELAAKALLRVAKIAAARGDAEAAKIVMDRIGKEFADTAAAKEAAKTTTPEQGASSEGKDVDEARKWLDEMLTSENDRSPNKGATIFRVLGAAEVMRIYQARGGRLENVLYSRQPGDLSTADWMLFATRKDLADRGRDVAIWQFSNSHPTAVPKELVDSIDDKIEPRSAARFFEVCVNIGTAEALAALASKADVLGRVFPHGGVTPPFGKLLENQNEGAADVMARLFAAAVADKSLEWIGQQFLSNSSVPALTLDTPGWRVVREWFPKFSSSTRVNFAYAIVNIPNVAPIDSVVQMLLADPEPTVRLRTIGGLLLSQNATLRTRAAKALAKEPRPVDVNAISNVVQKETPAFEELLDELSGPLLEWAYQMSFQWYPSPAAILHRGLERKDPEMLRALFRPQWPNSIEIDQGGSVSNGWSPAYQQLQQNGRLKSIAADSDATLMLKCVDAALALNDEVLAESALNAMGNDLNERFTKGVIDRFVAAGLSRVDRFFVQGNNVRDVSRESKLALMSRPSRETRSAAIKKFRDPSLLAQLATTADPIDLELIRQVAENLPEVQLVVLERAAPDSMMALKAFVSLVTKNDSALGIGLARGGDDRLGDAAVWVLRIIVVGGTWPVGARKAGENPPTEEEKKALHDKNVAEGNPLVLVLDAIEGLKVPEPFREELEKTLDAQHEQLARLKALGVVVEKHRTDWARALRDRQADRIIKDAELNPGNFQFIETAALDLASLEARENALRLLDDSNSTRRSLGLLCLAKLGDKAAIVKFAQDHPGSIEWVGAAIEAGARDEILASVAGGHLRRDEVLSQPAALKDVDLLCQLLLGGDRVGNFQNYSQQIKAAVENYVGKRDADSLMKIVTYYDSRDAVDALFALGEIGRVLDALPRWPNQAAQVAMEEFKRRTKIPAQFAGDLGYETVRRDYATQWKAALGL